VESIAGGGAVLDLGAVTIPLLAVEVFGRVCAIEVEIGAGKGRFALAWVEAHPEVGLLAVERALPYLRVMAQRALRRGLGNLRAVHTSAEDLLFRCLAPRSVQAVHVFFPDPWPKKRHLKRRFFRRENVARLAEILQVGGLLRIKSDHGAYAEAIAGMLAAEPRLAPVALDEAFAGIPETNFEVKYVREERRVYRFAYRRVEG